MSIAAGRLRHRVELQAPVHTQNPTTGEVVTTWTKKADVWAAVEPLSAREFIQSATTQSQITTRITIRYRQEIDATWRIVYRGKYYNIHGVLADKDSGIEYITLPCSEGVSDGQ